MDDAAFETDEERALWDAYSVVKAKTHPGTLHAPPHDFLMHCHFIFLGVTKHWLKKACLCRSVPPPGVDIRSFVEASSELVQPLEDFFNNVFVMVVSRVTLWHSS